MNDPLLFRRTMGRFPTGVTVVTTRDDAGRPWGMTANSFTSVSLTPPLISVCVDRRAGSFSAFSGCGMFGVSILAEHQRDLAVRFATPLDDKFTGLATREDHPGAILMSGAAATLACSVHTRVDIGDHVMLVGAVEECALGQSAPLGYCDGSFFTTAGVDTPVGERRPGRRILVGWLVEYDARILLSRDAATGAWRLPVGPLQAGPTMSAALVDTSRALMGQVIEPEFLYSAIDLSESETCHVYRARPSVLPEQTRDLRLFAEDEIPWAELSHSSMQVILRRYFDERVSDRFGIYLNLGAGRIAKIERESPWTADHAGDYERAVS
ncbi:flavin reductase [Sphaerisporangium krabiense]|uniref:Flavin reductase (DIM6/NTAB) family NADH-FMN oxidoreductase RutF n=1 Tax=Sphaerisporangium krabiense TaxID=763782 RepID=A0A7W8Z2A0_9ACTN|nr:flavin reductase [Sphaerisporangium krabiense]MBB5626131.1 flavin reductase (DIM6/NTAB) family NADH-FMN oxidoreductase RutF [Sphaerisporangium krabiense]GII67464.1 flavin reductase [Sphaerisporangium krabiense]